MKIEFNNQWYRETCKENELDPDNVLSKTAVDLAKQNAVAMRKYMNARKLYEDSTLQEKLDDQIKQLNEGRIGHMLDALWYAEIMKGLGKNAEKFIEKRAKRR